MYVNTFLIADVPVKVESVTSFPDWLCEGYRTDRSPELFLSMTPTDIEKERELTHNYSSPDPYIESLAVYRKFCGWASLKRMVMFHSSAIAVDGQAYLFAAPSGTGKSTHADLWKSILGERATIINDDKPILKCESDGIHVFGTPWNGSRHIGRCMSAPVRGICFLSQADKNRITALSVRQAFPLLVRQAYIPSGKQETISTIHLLNEITRNVSFWHLDCTVSEEAARLSYSSMKKGDGGVCE